MPGWSAQQSPSLPFLRRGCCLWRSGAWMLVGALSEDRIDVHRLEDGVPVAPPHSSTDAVSPAHLLFLPPRHQRERDARGKL